VSALGDNAIMMSKTIMLLKINRILSNKRNSKNKVSAFENEMSISRRCEVQGEYVIAWRDLNRHA